MAQPPRPVRQPGSVEHTVVDRNRFGKRWFEVTGRGQDDQAKRQLIRDQANVSDRTLERWAQAYAAGDLPTSEERKYNKKHRDHTREAEDTSTGRTGGRQRPRAS